MPLRTGLPLVLLGVAICDIFETRFRFVMDVNENMTMDCVYACISWRWILCYGVEMCLLTCYIPLLAFWLLDTVESHNDRYTLGHNCELSRCRQGCSLA